MAREDVRLMVQVQSGDRAALASLYDRYAGYLLAIGCRMASSREAAEDILQDVFVEAWQKAGQYRPDRASVKTWLSIRMRSRCLDRLKEHAQSKSEAMPDGYEPPSHFSSGRLPRLVDAGRAADALAKLPSEQRTVLELGYYRGLSSTEISEQLGVPTGTVKSRTRAALATLRDGFGGEK
ncbi:MAG: RNA polymerase sigma-70 factor (ECF subfamily) [Bradymonadia bacterium]|jgi:RNA polymerase sigma-70 factor (ECF subfamily)